MLRKKLTLGELWAEAGTKPEQVLAAPSGLSGAHLHRICVIVIVTIVFNNIEK